MRASAALIGLGFLLIAAQVAFSDGARPNLVALPIGMAPVTAGFVVLAVGIFVGAVRGNRSFRLGVLLLAVATVLFLGGLLLIHVPSMWPIIAGLVVGLAGLVLCVAGLRDAPAHT